MDWSKITSIEKYVQSSTEDLLFFDSISVVLILYNK